MFRSRLQDLVAFLSELHVLRIDLYLHQQGVDTTTPASKALFQMMVVFAEFERPMIQERVRAGLARARSEGKQLGRPGGSGSAAALARCSGSAALSKSPQAMDDHGVGLISSPELGVA